MKAPSKWPSTLGIRLTKAQRESIEKLVSQGKYKTISHFVRQAIEAELKAQNLQLLFQEES